MKSKKQQKADLQFVIESQKLSGFPGNIKSFDHQPNMSKISRAAKRFGAQIPCKIFKNSRGKPLLVVAILNEMFRRVGREFTPSECLEPDWYLKTTWTPEQRDDFQRWLAALFFRRGYSKAKSNYYAAMFALFFGWKVEDPQERFKMRQKCGSPERKRKSLAEVRKRVSWKKRRAKALERLALLGVTAKNLLVSTKQLERLLDELESGGPS